MALIKCPECGQMVSDQAEVCIHCGAPLKKMLQPAKIKTLSGHYNVFIYDASTNNLLWEGHGGQIASLDISKPTTINYSWSLFSRATKNALDKQYQIEPGKKYQEISFSTWNYVRFALNEVDVIDSE